jgi:hypothetical protein
MSMNFFDFPAEIRLQIYEELLVLSEPVTLMLGLQLSENNPPRPAVFLHKRYGLCPALLRASKSVYHEASPLLYSRNRFEFTDLTYMVTRRLSALALFFSQTGDKNASFIRHLYIDFPTFRKDDISIKTPELAMIREKCTNIAILEMSLCDFSLSDNYNTSDTLELLDISSLKEVIVHIYSYKVPKFDLKKKMRDYGWTYLDETIKSACSSFVIASFSTRVASH